MQVSVLGIDLGKNVCSIVGLDASGAVILRRRVKRETLIGLAAKLPPCIVAMEACCGAHHLGRLFANQEHEVRLMSPEYVRPYVKAQKNDDRDAGPTSIDHRRQAEAFRHQQARQQISAQITDPRCARGFATPCRARHGAWPMGQGIARPRASECRRCGLGQQAGADRLGRAAARRNIHREGSVLGGVGIGWSAHKALTDQRCLRVVN